MKFRPRILLVDDEVGLTRLLRRSLEEAGYEVRTANSGWAGLAALDDFHPDLVLLDVIMPGMTGREVADSIRRDPDFGRTPIIFVTALPPTEACSSDSRTLDGYPCIEKPLRAEEVIAAIEAALQKRRSAGSDAI